MLRNLTKLAGGDLQRNGILTFGDLRRDRDDASGIPVRETTSLSNADSTK